MVSTDRVHMSSSMKVVHCIFVRPIFVTIKSALILPKRLAIPHADEFVRESVLAVTFSLATREPSASSLLHRRMLLRLCAVLRRRSGALSMKIG